MLLALSPVPIPGHPGPSLLARHECPLQARSGPEKHSFAQLSLNFNRTEPGHVILGARWLRAYSQVLSRGGFVAVGMLQLEDMLEKLPDVVTGLTHRMKRVLLEDGA